MDGDGFSVAIADAGISGPASAFNYPQDGEARRAGGRGRLVRWEAETRCHLFFCVVSYLMNIELKLIC